ncbi:MAG: methyltransferase domain-containing protein [Eubacteriales bacterium]|nr:methyltransferase domain-containing protein [Eubacteriales bacterium]
MEYTKINAAVIDSWVDNGWEWGRYLTHDEYLSALNGTFEVRLTPTKNVPKEWLGNLKGKKILGLASGGGQQMPVCTALGAKCTVLDYSDRQLENERIVAKREDYAIHIVKADMTKPLPFEDGSFDMIFHPVSNCYVEEVKPIWKECYRVLKEGGSLLSGLDIGVNYIFDNDEQTVTNTLPFNPLKNKDHLRQLQESGGGIQFSHTIEEQINGQLEAGFTLKSLYDDTNSSGNLHEHNIASFIASWCVK